MQQPVNVLTGELISDERGLWNDTTLSWETVVASRAEARHAMVQQRRQHAEFSREFEHYRATVDAGGPAQLLHPRDDHPTDALAD